MSKYKAVLFDLDDTLLDRNQAVDHMFLLILEKCYMNVNQSVRVDMLHRFKDYDKRSYGHRDKSNVLDSFFNDFPPLYRLPRHEIQDFWNTHFPHCFSIDQSTLNILNMIKKQVKVAIVTNGSSQRQKAKIMNTDLNSYVDVIIISEEVGYCKPDKRIFELALNKLNVEPEDALFVGDDLEKDIVGCQNASIKGIWYNPQMSNNDTEIKPDAEVDSLGNLVEYFT
ncbi:HAD family hydrolase [Bacillus sinesaloumensis]|uniref:HAD family hydrolase n=1 Tax=Litchfieldia sinesaloumensis TaxID=1926280 RepID=UPI0009888783|nr:HAD-IA family hydrolase [Bacillus sinesaloumensis]